MLCARSRHRVNCECASLRSYYGSHLFKCIIPACGFYRIGFQTIRERESHQRTHDRPFKCAVLKCDFSTIGFTSKSDLGQHTSQRHPDSGAAAAAPAATNEFGGRHEFMQIMSDAVRAGEVCHVRDHISLCTVPEGSRLLAEAVPGSSLEMLELLISSGAEVNEHHLRQATAAGRTDTVAYLLSHGAKGNDHALGNALGSLSHEQLQLLSDHGASSKNSHIINEKFRRALKKVMDEEDMEKLKKCIALVTQFGHFEEISSHFLKQVASLNCSIAIAQYLLENGADIDAHGVSKASGLGFIYPPLYYAAKNSSERAAEFSKFLLLSGANPTIRCFKGNRAGDMIGAKNISKHLGMTWDELVEWAEAERDAAKALGVDPTATMLAELGHRVS